MCSQPSGTGLPLVTDSTIRISSPANVCVCARCRSSVTSERATLFHSQDTAIVSIPVAAERDQDALAGYQPGGQQCNEQQDPELLPENPLCVGRRSAPILPAPPSRHERQQLVDWALRQRLLLDRDRHGGHNGVNHLLGGNRSQPCRGG